MRKLSLFAVMAAFGMMAATSQGQGVMYGVSNNGAGASLYTLNTTTGAATHVGSLGVGASFSGLEYMNGSLYVTDMFNSTSGFSFGSINVTTGAATIISAQPSTNMWGLAGDASQNLLYTVDFDNGNLLKSITTSGVFTTIGATGINFMGTGLAFNSSTGVLYGTAFDSNLYTINTATGAATLVGATGLTFNNAWQGLAYDPTLNKLFMNSAETDSLYSINMSTGAATLIGANGATDGNGIDGLAFAPVPEPASMTALGLGVLALLRRRKKG